MSALRSFQFTRRSSVAAVALCALVLSVSPVFAQATGETAIEGYAFNAETLKPLKNVRIGVEIFDTTHGVGFSAITDANGFYSLSFDPTIYVTSVESIQAAAGCIISDTRAVNKPFALYTAVRPIVYQRNVYISLPRGATRCR